MFQFQPFTDAEIAADPRLAALVIDKKRILEQLQEIIAECRPSQARDCVEQVLDVERRVQRQREATHLATMQAENVRRGWKPTTLREILGEPLYDSTAHDDEQTD